MTMRGAWGAIVALALVGGLVGSPAAAEPNAARPQAKQAEADVMDQLIEGALGDKPQATIDRIDGMIGRTTDKVDRAFLLALRGAGLLGTGKIDAAVRDFDDARRLAPDDGLADRIRFIAGLAHDRSDQAAIALDRLLTGPTANVMALDLPLMAKYLANDDVAKARVDDHRIALAKLNFGGFDGIYIRLGALRTLLARGRAAEATALVPGIDEVDAVQRALIDRRLETMWPTLERGAGPNMATLIAKNVADAEAAFAEDPSNADHRQRLMTVLALARRTTQVLERGAEIGRTREALASLDEQQGWVVNRHALELYRAGRREDADRRYAELVAANPEKSWIVNMAINRVELLAQVGNHAAAEKLLPFTEQVGKSFGSPYARQLIRRMQLCTAIGLKQTSRVPALLAELPKFGKDASTATVEGLLCAGDAAGAERVVLDGLAIEDSRGDYVLLLQRKPLDPDDPSLWIAAWPGLRARPAIEAAFLAAGRDLPDLYHVK